MAYHAASRGIVLAAALVGVGASAAWAQNGMQQGIVSGSTLPANAPTGMGVPSVNPTAPKSSRRAEVEYTGGLLHVTANNASLNQILRDVGRLTGMKITGGVQDDRVFGSYGPAPASEVLATLLDGTATNLMIVENDQNGPAELILTPKHGGASPPNPNAVSLSDESDAAPQRPPEQSQPQPGAFQNRPPGPSGPGGIGGLPPSNGGQTGTPIDGGANLGVTPGAFAGYGQTPPDATAQPAVASPGSGDASQPQSPGGVSTPQQIYEQLQKLRQQQQNNPPPQ